MMRILSVLMCCLVWTLTAVAWAQGPQPVGQVYKIPGEIWTKDNQTTCAEFLLIVPSQLDEQGTFTMIARNVSLARLARLQRSAVPEELAPVFGDSPEAFIRVFEGGEFSNYRMTGNQMVIEVPYDRARPNATRKVQLLDAGGAPFTDAQVQVSLHGRYSSYQMPPFAVDVDDQGMVRLPVVVDWLHSREQGAEEGGRLSDQPERLYDLTISDGRTGQHYKVELMQFSRSPVTKVHLPILHNEDASGSNQAEVLLTTADGGPGVNTTVTVMRSQRAIVRSDLLRREDLEDIYVNRVSPGADGRIRLAFSPAFKFAVAGGQQLTVAIREDYSRDNELFPDTSASLQLGQETKIELPRRLSLTVSLIKANGEAVNAGEQAWDNEWGGVHITRLLEDCKDNISRPLTFRTSDGLWTNANTTGTVFRLDYLPVPGRYLLENRGVRYGPIEISETSPTEVLRIVENADAGAVRGRVFDGNRQPLAGALVVVVRRDEAYRAIMRVEGIAGELAALDTTASMKRLEQITSGVKTFAMTDASGAFAIPRKDIVPFDHQNSYAVIADNRFGANIGNLKTECDSDVMSDITLPDVHLPEIAYATGSVHAPGMVPVYDNPGTKRPQNPDKDIYRVGVGPSWRWFGQGRLGNSYWQYDTMPTTATLREPFRVRIPVGVPVRVHAGAPNLPLASHYWRETTATLTGEEINIGAGRLQEMYPFKLKVSYADGTPAEGLYIAMGGIFLDRMENGERIQPILDEKGEIMLFTQYSVTPTIEVMNQYAPGLREEFPGQNLDKTTRPHSVTITLSPDKWQQMAVDDRGRKRH